MSRILIVRIGGMGDIVMASALLDRIRRERPHAHVTWICGARFVDLVRLFGVEEIVPIDETNMRADHLGRLVPALAPVLARVAARPFDEVLVVHPDPGYRALVLSSLARGYTTTEANPGRGMVPGRYWADQFAGMLGGDSTGPIERRDDVVDVRGRLDPTGFRLADAPRVVLVPGGGRQVVPNGPLRRWPVERYVELAARLTTAGRHVALIGDANDAWVRPFFTGVPLADHIDDLSIADTLRLMRDSAITVSHDTGPMHLTRLVRARLVALFGPTVPAQHLPGGENVFWGGAHLACRPCWGSRDTPKCRSNLCMQDISTDAVFKRVIEITEAQS